MRDVFALELATQVLADDSYVVSYPYLSPLSSFMPLSHTHCSPMRRTLLSDRLLPADAQSHHKQTPLPEKSVAIAGSAISDQTGSQKPAPVASDSPASVAIRPATSR